MSFHSVYFAGLGAIGALALLSLYCSLRRARQRHTSLRNWARDWLADFSTEMVGAFLTVLVFGLIVTIVQDETQRRADKAQLMWRLGSTEHRIALSAAEDMLAKGWLRDGTLQGVNLIGANLEGSFLKSGNFHGALLNWANLRGAFLMHADLQEANLFAANACGAVLANADLQKANLNGTNLRDASLTSADLRGATLLEANLRGVVFRWTTFDVNTTLPDGTYWTPDTDMRQFTDPNAPEFYEVSYEYEPEDTDCRALVPPDRPR